jgi:hypothetical protein
VRGVVTVCNIEMLDGNALSVSFPATTISSLFLLPAPAGDEKSCVIAESLESRLSLLQKKYQTSLTRQVCDLI